MAHFISKTLLACGIAAAATTLCVPSSFAADVKKPVKAKKARYKSTIKAPVEADSIKPAIHEDEPDISDKHSVDFNCELGNKVTVYSNDNDPSHIALRWKKRLHRLLRVGTTTGAQRFENTNFGLTWIGIPSKGMLLDSKLNRQLANECKNAAQEIEEKTLAALPAKPDLIAPVGKVVVEPAAPPAALAQPLIPGAAVAAPVRARVPSLTPAMSPSVTPGVPVQVEPAPPAASEVMN